MTIAKTHELELLQSKEFRQSDTERSEGAKIAEILWVSVVLLATKNLYHILSKGKHHVYRSFGDDISLITEVILTGKNQRMYEQTD